MEFQDVVGDEYLGGIFCSSFLRVGSANFFLRNVTRCNDSSPIMANPSMVLSDLQACRCSSTVKVSDFGKRAELTVWTCSC
ncbi:unnamed protein product [Brassica oleracea]|uniref:(rape) hypothetical protein n=1 Tax=Brassica napus TaxID=3708 RepID=A0A816UB03_BRANA|nr:unnamed protein product [Brassica napus]